MRNNIGMKRMEAALLALLLAAPTLASAQAFGDLLDQAGSGNGVSAPLPPAATPPAAVGFTEARQYLPPDNDNPGFKWPDGNISRGAVPAGDFFRTGKEQAYLAAAAGAAGGCALAANTVYRTAGRPGFEGDYVIVRLADPLPGCGLRKGYVNMADVSASSAGGAWELPRNVRAFLDTLAYAEGVNEHYDYIFTFVTFSSYADHPRKRICSGHLCSDAAGRYQFLSSTWDSLARSLGLADFTPPSQEKAVMEIIRRAGAYKAVEKSDVYANFTAALKRLNGTWASLPGSPYGQPTHSSAALWKYYKTALARY